MAGGNGSAALHVSPGAYCGDGHELRVIRSEQDHINSRLDRQDEEFGKVLAEVAEVQQRLGKPSGEGGLAGTQARMATHLLDQDRRMDRVEGSVKNLDGKMDRVIEAVTRSNSDRPMPPLDYGDDAGEITKMQAAPLLVKRMKRAETHKKIAIVIASITALVAALTQLAGVVGGWFK